jgi:probable addiction module antidote protein
MRSRINPKAARKLGVRPFDAAEYLRDETDIAAYLAAAAAEEDPRVLAAALGAVARARGMADLARKTGLTREALYRSLSAEGNPELATLTKVLKALGMRLTIQPAAS